jgi:oxygen-independent coproporphyrinogen-3 oxidase
MAGVYISYPFCSQKCTYCNFASAVLPRELETRYLTALGREIAAFPWEWNPETVFLGGGTPSRMDASALAGLLSQVPGRPWSEATIEAAPGTLSAELVQSWREAGINRVSLGVQSFVEAELRRTGRRHSAETVTGDVVLLRAAGLTNFNIDLIAGLPGQTRRSWDESLEWVERLAAPHVSLYMLEVDEDSRLGQEVLFNGKRYGAPDVPPDEAIVEFYETGVARLRGMGVERYEISNFARPGFESLHNLKYWKLEPYAGFGADAHSFDGRIRRQNVEDAKEYCERSESGERLRVFEAEANLAEEKFFVGLRLSAGVIPEPEDWARWRTPIERFLADGLLERQGGTLRLTEQGLLFSNEVFQEFIGAAPIAAARA